LLIGHSYSNLEKVTDYISENQKRQQLQEQKIRMEEQQEEIQE